MAQPALAPLDSRLVDAALAILDEQGLEALSLRSIARRAGVSHGAPLRHYRGLSDLLSAVAARGFRLLRRTLDERSAALPAGAGARARLAAAGRGYVAKAVEQPDLFALMFRPDALDLTNRDFLYESSEAFEQVVRLVRSAQDEGFEPARDARLLAGCVWASVHGLASLWSQAAFSAVVPDASLEEAVETTLDLVLFPSGAPPRNATERARSRRSA